MKRMPVTLRIPTIVVALGLLSLCLCTMQDDEISRSNPCDPGGDNWTRDGIPVLHSVELDSTPLWSDFDFDNSTGSIEAVIHASDPNESYDTLGFRVFLGRSRESLDTVSASRDSFFTFTGLSPAETYHYRIEVFDTWDSMAVHTGRFVTPSGLPPRPPKSVSISPRTRSIRISWHVLSTDPAGRYRLYGNTSPRTAPFRLVLDTLVPLSSSVVSYSDYVDDYEPHYYVVAARNEYGESRCKDTLFSRCYKSGFSVPYDIQASLNGCRLVDLRWKLATSSSAVGFDIYRRRESSSYYRYVGRVPVSEETDFYTWYTYADTPATPGASYYRVAAVFDGGIPSKMSGDSAIARASLSAPYDVRATDGTYTHFVRLTWIAREGASGYGIYRSAGSCWSSGSETMVPVGTTDTTFYDDSVPAADSSYCYRVAAIDSCGHPGTRSSPVSGQRVSLKAPAHFTASDGTYANYVALTWNSVTGAHLYLVYRSSTPSGLDSTSALDTVENTSYRDTPITCETYHYQVAALDDADSVGPRSSINSGYRSGPLPPSSASATSGTFYEYVKITWSAVPNVAGYRVYRKTSLDDTYAELASTSDTCWHDSTAPQGTPAYYRVAAYDAGQAEGRRSRSTTGYRRAWSAPSALAASDDRYEDSIVVTWAAIAEAQSYTVYRATDSSTSSEYAKVATVDTPHYMDTDFRGGISFYYYKVSAYSDALGETPLSPYTVGSAARRPPNPPAITSIDSGYTTLTVHWTPSSDGPASNRYYVYRALNRTAGYVCIDTISVTSYVDSVCTDGVRYYRVAGSNRFGEGNRSDARGAAVRSVYAPGNFWASDETSHSHVRLIWHRVRGAARYNIYREGAGLAARTPLATTSETFYHDSTAPTQPVKYRVAAVTECGRVGSLSIHNFGSRKLFSPPAGLRATDQVYEDRVELQWRTVDSVESYHVFRSVDGGSFGLLTTVTANSYTDYEVNSLHAYHYKVASFREEIGLSEPCESVEGNVVKSPPAAPVLRPATATRETVSLCWSPDIPPAIGYYVYRSTSASFSDSVLRGSTASASYGDTVLGDTVYYYRCTAENVAGTSGGSTTVSGYRSPRMPPVAPASVSASQDEAGHVEVVWTPASDGSPVTEYRIYRSESQDGNYARVGTTSESTLDFYDYTAAAFPATFWYVVRAYNPAGESARSPAVEGWRR